MENEIETTLTSTSGLNNPVTTVERPLSPVERILQGQIDSRPIFTTNGKMDGLLIALAKVLKLLTKGKLSNQERQRAFECLDQISTDDIRKAVQDVNLQAIEEITSFEDITLHKVKAPEIDPGAVDYVSPQASKDFSTRINNGFFASVSRHSVKMKDILQAVADVVTFYKLSPKAALGLLRRSLRDPARQLMENLVSSNASLESLFTSLQDHYNTALSCTEASHRLRNLLSSPIVSLDDFLSDLLNLSIASVKDLPAAVQNNCGFLLATGYLNQYVHKHYPELSLIIKHDFKSLQSAQRTHDPSAAYLGMMRVLRLHRDAIESASKRPRPKNSINAIEFDDPPLDEESCTPTYAVPPQDDIKELIRNEIRQNFPKEKSEDKNEKGQMKAMLQEVIHECLSSQQNPPMPICPTQEMMYGAPGYIQEVQNPNWQRSPHSQPNRPPPTLPQQNQQQGIQRWLPQMMQRPGQMMGPQHPNGSPRGNPNRMMVGNSGFGNGSAPRRNFVPEEVYNKYFSQGNCFGCGMQGHSYRQCPIFGQGYTITSTACPDCESHGIKAFHENCNGRNYKAHQNMARPRQEQSGLNSGQNRVSQIDTSQFYPEEGMSFLPTQVDMIQQNFPLYIPNQVEHSKN